MSFLSSPFAKPLLIVLAFVAWTVYQRDQAAKGAREACQASQLAVTVDELNRQLEASQKATAAAEERNKKTDEALQALENESAKAVSSIPAKDRKGSCAIPADTIKRLRSIK